ncbi:MAG TPA: translation elongation factor Ts [Candidatus Krumholzibacteriaceae bacterium]|nr:translation elongation factor Ts [Candidatus Krumholzibacteriaceae bacterium]
MSIDAKQVKELRQRTGSGMMDCKKALQESDGDIEEAIKVLREKGLSAAAKRSGRDVSEGRIFSYVHPGAQIAVMVELNCETDFVARTEEFQNLGKDISMQVAATSPIAVKREDISSEAIENEREIFRNQALKSGKPEKVIEKIIEGRTEKFYHEVCLLEQPFVKDDKKSIEELVKEVMAKLGENIAIKRFARFEVGE